MGFTKIITVLLLMASTHFLFAQLKKDNLRIVVAGKEFPFGGGGGIGKSEIQQLYDWKIKDLADSETQVPMSFTWVISSYGQIFKGDSRADKDAFNKQAAQLKKGDIVFIDAVVWNKYRLGQLAFTIE